MSNQLSRTSLGEPRGAAALPSCRRCSAHGSHGRFASWQPARTWLGCAGSRAGYNSSSLAYVHPSQSSTRSSCVRLAALNNGATSSSRNSSKASSSASSAAAGPPSDEATAIATLAASLALGALLGGAGVGLDEALPPSVQRVSSFLGWSYFTAWSLSFAPQLIDNQRTHDVSGLSPDYVMFSLVGYLCYASYTGALYFSDDVRASYAALHGGAMPDISAADFSFATLAVVATLGVAVQHSLWRRPGDKVLSPFAVSVGGVVVLSVAGCAAHIHATCEGVTDCASWLPMLVLLGGFKVLMTVIKYTPQVLHNHQRGSTEGWSTPAVMLDVAGGVLSFSQVILDALARHDLSVITGNPAKLWVAGLSIGYDAIFLAQHFMYKKTPAAAQAGGIVGALAQPQPAAAVAREQPVLAFAAIDRRQGGRGGLKQRL